MKVQLGCGMLAERSAGTPDIRALNPLPHILTPAADSWHRRARGSVGRYGQGLMSTMHVLLHRLGDADRTWHGPARRTTMRGQQEQKQQAVTHFSRVAITKYDIHGPCTRKLRAATAPTSSYSAGRRRLWDIFWLSMT